MTNKITPKEVREKLGLSTYSRPDLVYPKGRKDVCAVGIETHVVRSLGWMNQKKMFEEHEVYLLCKSPAPWSAKENLIRSKLIETTGNYENRNIYHCAWIGPTAVREEEDGLIVEIRFQQYNLPSFDGGSGRECGTLEYKVNKKELGLEPEIRG